MNYEKFIFLALGLHSMCKKISSLGALLVCILEKAPSIVDKWTLLALKLYAPCF